jgi:hypothetical protein
VFALWVAYTAIQETLFKDSDNLMNKYRLTRYVLLYLLRRALDLDTVGKEFCSNPSKFLLQKNGRERLSSVITKVASDLVVDLDGEARERAESGSPLDYKREFKSPNAVRELEKNIISLYQKAVSRGRASSFGAEWKQSVPS